MTTQVPEKTVTLRKLTRDALPMFAVWRAEYAEYFSPSQATWCKSDWEHWYRNTHLRNPASHMFVIWSDCAPSGCIGFNSRTREIHGVLLHDQCRGQGIMRAAFWELYKAFGPGRVHLVVRSGNRHAHSFYEKIGFTHDVHTPGGNYRMIKYVTPEEC